MKTHAVVIAAALGLCACSNAPAEGDDASTAQMMRKDAFVPPNPGLDSRPFNPPADGGVPGGDAFVPPAADGGGPADDAFRPPAPDQGVPPGDPLVASIVLTEQPQADSASLSATVALRTELMTEPGCTVINVDPNAAAPATPSFDAGAITVVGPNGGPYTMNLTPGGGYPAPGVPDDLFNDGTMIQAQAAGGAHMGAFQLAVPAPAQVRISSPPEFSLAPYPANQDLAVRWTPSTSESLVLTAFPVASGFDPTPRAGRWVFCGVEDNGQTVVPGALLSQVGGSGSSALVVLTRTRIASATVGQHEAYLTASTTTGSLLTFQ